MITQEQAKQMFDYSNGKLYWKTSIRSDLIGKEAGWFDKNYLAIRIGSKRTQLHRIIFLWHHGYLPRLVDHRDGNKLNNAIENLRDATRAQNNQNAKLRKDNTSGVKGVMWHKQHQKWYVGIRVNKKAKFIGLFENLELAELVAIMAREKYHGKFANHG